MIDGKNAALKAEILTALGRFKTEITSQITEAFRLGKTTTKDKVHEYEYVANFVKDFRTLPFTSVEHLLEAENLLEDVQTIICFVIIRFYFA